MVAENFQKNQNNTAKIILPQKQESKTRPMFVLKQGLEKSKRHREKHKH